MSDTDISMDVVKIDKDQLPIIGAADENYARYLLVAFLSAIKNTKNREGLKFFCIDGGITGRTRDFMAREMKDRGADLLFLRVNEAEYAYYEVIKHLSSVAYYRLSIPDIFYGQAETVLYIDCDTLVLGDLYDLKGFSLSGDVLGAVEDASRSSHKASGVGKQNYFNSGVLLINVDAWVSSGFKEKVLSALKKENINNDQCALNVAANGQWARLPLQWNYQVGLYRNKRDMALRYGWQEYNKALFRPALIHFVGSDKPWGRACHHPWRNFYLPYIKMVSQDFDYLVGARLFFSALSSFKEFKKYLLGLVRRWRLTVRAGGAE